MTDGLKIAAGLALPENFVTESAAILARRGAGKTYTAAVLAEELIAANLQVVVLDPLGAFWGLRSGADGKRAGLPITILGGDHGDIPLPPTAGKVVADLVVDHPTSFVIDLSAFESNAEQDRFVTAFAERLYRRKGKDRRPLHLIMDEADSFAPQRPQSGGIQARMLGAIEAIVRRGRIRGLGVTLISQRAASLNKNVLTQTELLIVLQTTGPQDRKAIDDWVSSAGTPEERQELLDSIAKLDRGEAFVWSPAWLQVFKKIKVRKRYTFDSSRTPEAGQTPVVPARLAEVDLETLREHMAETIEAVERDDPVKLRRRIGELERELERRPEDLEPQIVIEKVPVVPEGVELLLETGTEQAGKLEGVVAGLNEALAGLRDAITRTVEKVTEENPKGIPRRIPNPPRTPTRIRPAEPDGDLLGRIGKGAPLDILKVLVSHPDGRSMRQVAAQAGLSPKRSTLRNAMSTLRTHECIEERGGLVFPSAAAVAAFGGPIELPSGDELRAKWHRDLGEGVPKRIFDMLEEAWPATVSSDHLADSLGIDPSTSTLRNALSRVRTLGALAGTRDGYTLPDELAESLRG